MLLPLCSSVVEVLAASGNGNTDTKQLFFLFCDDVLEYGVVLSSQHQSFPHETVLPSPQSTKNLFKKHCNKVRMLPTCIRRCRTLELSSISKLAAYWTSLACLMHRLSFIVPSEGILQTGASSQPADWGHTGRRSVSPIVWLSDSAADDSLPTMISLVTWGNKW